MDVIEIDNLTRRYGKHTAVDALAFEVRAGSLFGFLGPNGSGKSTTIRVLLGFLAPSAGRATVLGRDCWRESPRIKADVGYVSGDLRLYPWLSLDGAIPIWSRARRKDIRAEAGRLAEVFELQADVVVRRMSRGMRQKLGLILALAHRPRVLVLDEPTTALDPIMQERLYEELRARARGGDTVFFSSHTLSEVELLCDRVVILRRGHLLANESLDALRERASRVVTIRFVDGPGAMPERAPEFLRIIERDGRGWTATLDGPAPALLKWAASQQIEDISIGRPDLGRLFQQFYGDEEGVD